jgi:hypothetical protein
VLFILWVSESFYRRGLVAWWLVRKLLTLNHSHCFLPWEGHPLSPFLSGLFLLLWTIPCPFILLEQAWDWVSVATQIDFHFPVETVSIQPTMTSVRLSLETRTFRPLHCIQGHIRKHISKFWHVQTRRYPISLLFLRSALWMCFCMNQLIISYNRTKLLFFLTLCELP